MKIRNKSHGHAHRQTYMYIHTNTCINRIYKLDSRQRLKYFEMDEILAEYCSIVERLAELNTREDKIQCIAEIPKSHAAENFLNGFHEYQDKIIHFAQNIYTGLTGLSCSHRYRSDILHSFTLFGPIELFGFDKMPDKLRQLYNMELNYHYDLGRTEDILLLAIVTVLYNIREGDQTEPDDIIKPEPDFCCNDESTDKFWEFVHRYKSVIYQTYKYFYLSDSKYNHIRYITYFIEGYAMARLQ